MSNYATHHLGWPDPEPSWDDVVEAMARIRYAPDPDQAPTPGQLGQTQDAINGTPMLWPQAVAQVSAMSERWPEVVFNLLVQGEDLSTAVTFIRGGRHYTVFNETVEFDPARLA